MKNSIIHASVAWLISAAILGTVSSSVAQTTNKVPTEKKAPAQSTEAEKPAKGGPFHGKLAAIDKVAKTITVGKRTFQITSESKLKKSGKPATLEDGVVGETVSGYVKPSPDGKLVATTVNFGPKAAVTDSGEKPKPASTKEKEQK